MNTLQTLGCSGSSTYEAFQENRACHANTKLQKNTASGKITSVISTYRHIQLGSGDSDYQNKPHFCDILSNKKVVTVQQNPVISLNYNGMIYDNNRERFSALEWTLDYLIGKIWKDNSAESNGTKNEKSKQLTYFLPEDRTLAKQHLTYHIQQQHPDLTEKIVIDSSMPAENSVDSKTITGKDPHSLYYTFSDSIIPSGLSEDDHNKHLYKKLDKLVDLITKCNPTSQMEFLYIYDYLQEPEITECIKAARLHPYGYTIVGQSIRPENFPSAANAQVASLQPCPCILGKECPGNPEPYPDSPSISDDSEDEDYTPRFQDISLSDKRILINSESSDSSSDSDASTD